MSRISQNKSKEDFPERLKKNYLNIDSLDIDSLNSNSYIEDFDLEPNLSIPKILNDFNNFSNNIKNHNKNLGNKNDAKLEKTFSIMRAREKPLKGHIISSLKEKKILGRKKKGEAAAKKEDLSHGIYAEDNISVKIKTHYLNFIISFLNCIFPHLNYKKKLYKLDKGFKINIKKINSKDNIESLNDKTIGEIISNKISQKYRSIQDKTNANKIICEEIKNNPILNKILSENYLIFFKRFYYSTDSFINLKDYGLNKVIIFPKNVKNFKHLLKDNENRGEKYIMSIKEHVLRNYLPGLKFLC
jgi:hypothetical protein